MGKKSVFLFAAVFVALMCATAALGQDHRKFELFAGFSHNRVDVGPVEDSDPGDDLELDDIFDEREGFNGFNVSLVGNFHRYFGAKFDYSYHQKSFDFGPDNTTVRLHNILGGIQVKDNSTNGGALKPFAHALVGVGRTSADLSEFDDDLFDFDDAGFAAAFGGGLDLRLTERVDIRLFQIDYNPMKFDFTDFGAVGIPGTPTPTSNKRTLHNFRIGIGIVFH
jgi:opacity protein-like surface antigen